MEEESGAPPTSLEASQDAQAEVEALAATFSGEAVVAETPHMKGKSELARHRAGQKEIAKCIDQLPDRVRSQMDELFRANYTRIQILDLESSPDHKGKP